MKNWTPAIAFALIVSCLSASATRNEQMVELQKNEEARYGFVDTPKKEWFFTYHDVESLGTEEVTNKSLKKLYDQEQIYKQNGVHVLDAQCEPPQKKEYKAAGKAYYWEQKCWLFLS